MDLTINARDQNINCSQMAWGQKYTPIALSVVCFTSLIISIPGVALSINEYCVKNNISDLRTERLLLYMSLVASLFSLVGSFQWIAFYQPVNGTLTHLCSGIGYTWLVTGIFLEVITFCTGIHFLLQICNPKWLNVTREEKIIKYKRLECLYVTMAVFLSLILSPWPTIDNSFGYNKWICWINTRKNCSSNFTEVGFKQVTVLYSSIVLTFTFTLCVVIAVQVLICLKKRNTRNLYIPVFLVYLVVTFIIISITLIINFLNQYATSINEFQDISTVSIGTSPIAASLVTTIAAVYKIYQRRRSSSRMRLLQNNKHHQYQSTHDGTILITSTSSPLTINTSTSRSTYWDSPATDEINSSHVNDEY